MDGKGSWRDNVFVERLWRSVKYEEVYLHAYAASSKCAPRLIDIWTSITGGARIRALTRERRMRPTSPSRRSRGGMKPSRAILMQLWSGYALPPPHQNREAPQSA